MITTGMAGTVMITSHGESDIANERMPVRVVAVTSDDTSRSLHFQTEATTWEASFPKMKMQIGHTQDAHLVRRSQPSVVKRQASSTVTSATTSVRAYVPMASATSESVTLDLSTGPIIDGEALEPPVIPGDAAIESFPFNIGCQNCSTSGSLKLVAGEFDYEASRSLTHLITSGYFDIDLTDFHAVADLWVEPNLKGQYTLPIAAIPTPAGVDIGIGSAGITFELDLVLEWQLEGGVRLGFGAEIDLPSASLHLDLVNLNHSTVTGLDSMTVTTLPFDANITALNVTFSASLQPRIAAGASFGDMFTAGAAVYLNTPRMDVSVAELPPSLYDTKCESRRPYTALSEVEDAVLKALPFGMTHITGSAHVGAGSELSLRWMNDKDAFGQTYEIVATERDFATKCYAFFADLPTGLPGDATAAAAMASHTHFVEVSRLVESASASIAAAKASITRAADGEIGKKSAASGRLGGETWLLSMVVLGLGVVAGGMIML